MDFINNLENKLRKNYIKWQGIYTLFFYGIISWGDNYAKQR